MSFPPVVQYLQLFWTFQNKVKRYAFYLYSVAESSHVLFGHSYRHAKKAIQNILDMECYFSKVPQLMASFMSSSRANNPLR